MEKELKSKSDFSGLLEYSISKVCSLTSLGEKFCKIAYYSGRMKNQNKLNLFIEENKGLIVFYVSKEYKELSEFLFKVGQVFPELSDEYYRKLEAYYFNPKYYDMLEDILFDQDLLKRELKKFDASVRSIRNFDFSDELLFDVFNAAMSNMNVIDEQVHYYDKEENIIKVMTYGSEKIIRNVHIIVHLFRDNKDFSDSVDEFIGIKVRKEFFKRHQKDIYSESRYSDIIDYSFELETFELFKQFVTESQDTLKIDSNAIERLIKESSLKWLKKANSL